MARKSKSASKSKTKKTIITIITAIIVIALIAVIIYISVKGMWGDVIDYLKSIAQRDETNPDQDDATLVPDGTLEVKVLDVGQGDCILITFPDGQRMIMDAGADANNVALTALDSELADKGIMSIEYLFLTHTDQDHSRDMQAILDKYEVKNIYYPRANTDVSKTWERAYNAAKSETYVENGETKQAQFNENIGAFRLETTSWRMKCYSFDEEDYPNISASYKPAEKVNSVSPICLLEYADRTIVLTGDANFETEEYVLAKGYLNNIDADVLKVGHHGSASSTSDEFLNKIDCEYAIISCGEGNKYGHPTPEALTRLAEYTDERPDDDFNGFAEVYRTDEDGTITVRVDEKGVMQIASADSPDKNATVGGVFQEEEVQPSGEVATAAYFRQEDYFLSLAA